MIEDSYRVRPTGCGMIPTIPIFCTWKVNQSVNLNKKWLDSFASNPYVRNLSASQPSHPTPEVWTFRVSDIPTSLALPECSNPPSSHRSICQQTAKLETLRKSALSQLSCSFERLGSFSEWRALLLLNQQSKRTAINDFCARKMPWIWLRHHLRPLPMFKALQNSRSH